MAIRGSSLASAIVPVGGPAGLSGQSTYAAWLALGNTGSLADFMAAQKGAPGGVTTLAGKIGALSLDDIGALAKTGDASDTRVSSPFGVKRGQSQRANDRITIEDLGGGTDKTAAENLAALTDPRAAGRTVRLGDGTYLVAGTVTLPIATSGRATSLAGNGRDRTKLLNTTANSATIKINDYVSYPVLFTRTVDLGWRA